MRNNKDVPVKIGDGDFGSIYSGVTGQNAIEYLLKAKEGEVQAAFTRLDIGDIDLVWGREGVHGYGLAHFKNRVGALKNLTDVVENGIMEKSRDDRALLIKQVKGSGGFAVVQLKWKGDLKRWIISSY